MYGTSKNSYKCFSSLSFQRGNKKGIWPSIERKHYDWQETLVTRGNRTTLLIGSSQAVPLLCLGPRGIRNCWRLGGAERA